MLTSAMTNLRPIFATDGFPSRRLTHEKEVVRSCVPGSRRQSQVGRKRDGLSETSAFCKPGTCASFPIALQRRFVRPRPNCSLRVHGQYDLAQLPQDQS